MTRLHPAILKAVSAAVLASFVTACDSPSQSGSAAPQASAPHPAPVPVPSPRQRWPFLSPNSGDMAASEFSPAAMMKRNYYVVLDASGSMADGSCFGSERKIVVAKRALLEFAAKLPDKANFGLAVFDGGGLRQLLPINTINRDAIRKAIQPVVPGNGTPLAQSIRSGYGALTEQGKKQSGYGEYHLVVITDGAATDADPRDAVDAMLKSSPIVMHTIGFCIDNEHALNQPGRVVYRSANNFDELAQGLADVLAEAPDFNVKSFQ